jgi:hypothetical protein
MRTGRPAPQAEQGQLAISRWQESRNSPRLPRFHYDQQITGLQLEIRSIASAVPNQLDAPAGGNSAGARVGRCTRTGGKPERGSGQTETRRTPFGVGAAANIAVAYENDARHPPPADLLELAISPRQVFEARKHQAYEPAVSAKARPHSHGIPTPQRHRARRKFPFGFTVHRHSSAARAALDELVAALVAFPC